MNNYNQKDDCFKETRRKVEEANRNRPIFVIGPTGPTGPTGPAGGETPTLTIGTVTTGDPGTEASATITGTAPNFVLNLTIPQGPTGPAPVVVNDVK